MTFIHRSLARSAVAGALLGCALTAQAAITVYTSEAAFQAVIVNPAVDRFDDLNVVDGAGDAMAFGSGPYGYTASADGGLYRVGSAVDGWLSSNMALPIVFSDFSGGVQAIGGYFFATDLAGDHLAGESVEVMASDASGTWTYTLVDPSTTSFLGFVSTGAIDVLQVTPVDSGSNNAWATVNNLTLAQAVAPVPEPQTGALWLGGVAALAVLARKRAAGAAAA